MLAVAAIYIVAVLLLCGGFYTAHPLGTLQQVGKAAAAALSAMRDPSLDELAKEVTVQRCALEMTRQAVALAFKLAVILLAAAFPVWLAVSLGWTEMDAFWSFALRTDVLLITTAAVLVPLIASGRFGKSSR